MITAVCISYNNSHDAIRLVRELDGIVDSLIIIENGTSIELLKEHLKRHSYTSELVIRHECTNPGFASSVNIGLGIAFEEMKSRYVWILNPDCVIKEELKKEFIDEMIMAIDLEYDHAGLTWVQQESERAQSSTIYKLLAGYAKSLSKYAGQSKISREAYKRVQKTQLLSQRDIIQGSSMVVTRDFFFNVGRINEEFFMYREEDEWCMRGLIKGYINYEYAGRLSKMVEHKEWKHRNRTPAYVVYYQARNFILLLQVLNIYKLLAVALTLLYCVNQLMSYIKHVFQTEIKFFVISGFQGKVRARNSENFRIFIQGIYDGSRGVTGKKNQFH